MRVAIHYEDGYYFMYDPAQHMFAEVVDEAWMKANTIVIPDDEWECYQAFLAQGHRWNNLLEDYSNIIQDRNKE